MVVTRSQTEPRLATKFANSCHTQVASPLFNNLSAEVRNMIFKYVMTEDDNSARLRKFNATQKCPVDNLEKKKMISTALLLTCRRAYVESCGLPVFLNQHVFWSRAYSERQNESERPSRFHMYFSRMKQWQKQDVRDVRIIINLACVKNLSLRGYERTIIQESPTQLVLQNATRLVLELRTWEDHIMGRESDAWESWVHQPHFTQRLTEFINKFVNLKELIIEYEIQEVDGEFNSDKKFRLNALRWNLKRLEYKSEYDGEELSRPKQTHIHSRIYPRTSSSTVAYTRRAIKWVAKL